MLYDLFYACLTANYNNCPGSCDYAIQIHRNTLYLFFKKSDGKEDWINNLDFPAKAYCPSGEKWYCHRGFLRAWTNIVERLDCRIRDIINRHENIRRLVIVGYSHGAALSVFALDHFSFLYGDTLEIQAYGFGAPRVVFGKLPPDVKERLKAFIVIRNIPDLVTHLPPSFLLYRHVGHMLKIGEAGKFGPVIAHTPNAYLDSLYELKQK